MDGVSHAAQPFSALVRARAWLADLQVHNHAEILKINRQAMRNKLQVLTEDSPYPGSIHGNKVEVHYHYPPVSAESPPAVVAPAVTPPTAVAPTPTPPVIPPVIPPATKTVTIVELRYPDGRVVPIYRG